MHFPIRLLTFFLALGGTATVHAQGTKPVDGTWSMAGKPHRLVHVVAHETEVFGKPGIAVLASDRPFNLEAIKNSLQDKKGNADVSSRQPYVRVTFERSGKVSSYYATASGFTTNGSGDALSGELKSMEIASAAMPNSLRREKANFSAALSSNSRRAYLAPRPNRRSKFPRWPSRASRAHSKAMGKTAALRSFQFDAASPSPTSRAWY